jgi:hypothetical protein
MITQGLDSLPTTLFLAVSVPAFAGTTSCGIAG